MNQDTRPGEPGAPRILLVDDDPNVRKTLRALLAEVGYQVEEAADGAQALEALERSCPDLLLSDLVMPPPTGEVLAKECLGRCPDTVVVLMSGYSEDELHDLDIKQVVFIPKAADPTELRNTIGKLLQ